MAKLFLSHSSEDKTFVKKLANDLIKNGHKPWLDEWEIKIGDCIVSKIERGIDDADYLILVLSRSAVKSGWVEKEWKTKYWDEVSKSHVMILPVLIDDCELPLLIRTKKYADFRTNYKLAFGELLEALLERGNSKETSVINKLTKNKINFIEHEGIVVDINHLPKPTVALVGRKKQIASLTEAFVDPHIHLTTIIAAGGIGKSALIDEWLKLIHTNQYYGKKYIFGWSFYSQGSHNTFTNSQPFFRAALRFLGVDNIPKDEIEKARLLAKCLLKNSCLLILDGLEPLQYSQSLLVMSGELKDAPLKEFISCFRRTPGNSFLLFSSRQPLVELKNWQKENFLQLDLQTMPNDDGAKLLKTLGVTNSLEKRLVISQDLNGHALSLVLMGHLLREHHHGNSQYAQELLPLASGYSDSDAEKDSRHALRVLDYYDKLQDSSSRCFLELLGLFDRPMDSEEKAILMEHSEHAKSLRALTDMEWKLVENQLEKTGLLLGKKGRFSRLEWDTHPIIRTYYGDKFKTQDLDSYKQAHSVLFKHYQNQPGVELPMSLKEMQPLYRAMAHGFLSEQYQEILFDVFDKRIMRGNEFYSAYTLGDYSNLISALTLFNWRDLSQYNINEFKQIWLLKTIAHCFISLGFFQNTIDVSLVSLALSKKQKNWAGASSIARVLANSYQPLGMLPQAKATAEKAIKYATRSKDTLEIVLNECRYAHILQLSGDLKGAINLCEEAEKLLIKEGFKYLITVSGFKYCSILIDSTMDYGQLNIIISRGKYLAQEKTIELNVGLSNTLDVALGKLVIARAYFSLGDFINAENYFNESIDHIKRAHRIEYTPQVYLNRAEFYLSNNEPEKSLADLNSAWSDIERCNMKFYAVDYLLIYSRLCLVINDFGNALSNYEEAKQLIQEIGYHLRDAELDLLAAELCQKKLSLSEENDVDFYLQRSKNRIFNTGQFGLMARWDQVYKTLR